MKCKKAELIEKWLKEGSDDAKSIVDLPWQVEKETGEDESQITLVATHLRFPLPIIFRIDNYNTTIIIDLGYVTDSLDVRDRMEIYRNLLKANTQIPYAKTGLVGDDLDIVIFGEIETCRVEHDELNNRIEILLNGLFRVAKAIGLEEELIQLTIENISYFIQNKMNAGMKKEEIEDYLSKKLALPKENVDEIVDKVYKERKEDVGHIYG